MLPVEQPFKTYTGTDGKPLDGGYVYFGQPNQDPITHPVTVYWDAAGTQPALQPIRTVNGYLVRTGTTPANVFFDGAYSELVQDAKRRQVFYARTSDDFSIATVVLNFLASIASSIGSSLIGFIQAGFGATVRTVQDKLRERVSVADFLTTPTPTAAQATAAIQEAFNSGAKKVFISADYQVNSGVQPAANQIVDFDGGSLTTTGAAAAFPNGVLYANGKSGIRIIDPIIDASSTAGVRNISFINCLNARVDGGLLTGGIIGLEGPNNATRMDYKVRGTIINAGFAAPCVYVSAVLGAVLEGLSLSTGQEGVGIYNDSRNIKHTDCDSFSQTQDGFVVIAGQRISYTNCNAYSNGQSGFTTQRQTAGTNTQRVSYSGCQSYDNAFDGFDLRGDADGASWSADMMMTCVGCVSTGNTGTGFYVVSAEGAQLSGCFASGNQQQNYFLNGSNRVTMTGCESASGANAVAAGVNKAGIIVFNSSGCAITGCISTNSAGATQSYGISFTGTSTACTVVGGIYENNIAAPYNLISGNRLVAAQADTLSGSGVFLLEISAHGSFVEEGFGIPSHTRAKGSQFMRLDGGGAELYLSNGGGSWSKLL